MAKPNPTPVTPKSAAKPAAKPTPTNADGAAAGAEAETKPRAVRKLVDFTALERNAEGKIVKAPAGVTIETPDDDTACFDWRKHKPLARDEFASEAEFLRFRANVTRGRIGFMTQTVEAYEKRAADLERYGTPEQRKAAQRRERLMKEIAKLDQTLAEAGVTVDDDSTDA